MKAPVEDRLTASIRNDYQWSADHVERDLFRQQVHEAVVELRRLRAAQTPREQALLAAINRACAIVELGDQRVCASDGPAGGCAPELSLKEWRTLYLTLDTARKA